MVKLRSAPDHDTAEQAHDDALAALADGVRLAEQLWAEEGAVLVGKKKSVVPAAAKTEAVDQVRDGSTR